MFTHKEILKLEERAKSSEAEAYKLRTLLKAIRSSIDCYLEGETVRDFKVVRPNFGEKK